MKKIAICFSLILGVGGITYSQTEVSGGIYENTTWTADESPYIVTEGIVVFDDVELTIEPGVEVRFNLGTNLELRGKLSAIGTETDSILFTSNAAVPARHDWNGIYVKGNTDPSYGGGQVTMRYLRGEYAKDFINLDIAYNGPYEFSHCTFYDNSKVNIDGGGPITRFTACDVRNNGQGIDWCQFDSEVIDCKIIDNGLGVRGVDLIEGCLFSGNTIAMVPYGEAKNCVVKNNEVGVKGSFNAVNNTFVGNTVYGNVVGVEIESFFSESVDFTGNTICNNSFYDVKYLSTNNGNLSNNCWCSEDHEEIKGNIYDGYDDIAYGLVTFTPFEEDCELASVTTDILDLNVSVYPNPFLNEITFAVESDEEISLEIMDLTGKVIFSASFYNSTLVEQMDFASGVYVYHLRDQSGNESIGKIIKQ